MFHGIKIYTVHVKSGTHRPQEKPVFINEGFNWYAFLFTSFWALYHRLWLHALLIIAFNLVLIVVSKNHIMATQSLTIIQLGSQLVIGFFANDWLRAKLGRRGYIFTDITASDGKMRAEQRYFERYLSHV